MRHDFEHFIDEVNSKIYLFPQKYQGVVVACSGGPDSTALFELFWRFAKAQKNFSLALFHVNFGLRGKESEEDEAFLRSMAAERQISFKCLKLGPKERQARQGEGVQAWARRIRREAFATLGREGWIVATAHHRDDLAETALFRLARGTSPGGLQGLKTWDPPLWRPLLGERKIALLNYLEQNKIAYRTDSSNAELTYDRNIIRHQVLPELEKLHPGAAGRIAACAEEARVLYEFCRAELARRLAATDCNAPALLSSLPRPLAMTALTELLAQSGLRHRQLSKSWLEQALDRVCRHSLAAIPQPWAFDIPGGGRFVSDAKGKLTAELEVARPRKSARIAQHARNLAETSISMLLEPSSYAFIRHDARWLTLGNVPIQKSATPLSSACLRVYGVKANKPLRFQDSSKPWSLSELLRRWDVPLEARRKTLIIERDGALTGLILGEKLLCPDTAGKKTQGSDLSTDLRYW